MISLSLSASLRFSQSLSVYLTTSTTCPCHLNENRQNIERLSPPTHFLNKALMQPGTWTVKCHLINPLIHKTKYLCGSNLTSALPSHIFTQLHHPDSLRCQRLSSIRLCLNIIQLCCRQRRIPGVTYDHWYGRGEKESTRSALMGMLILIPLSSKNNKVMENLSQECWNKTSGVIRVNLPLGRKAGSSQ
jgi:hypothetical protein